MSKLQPDTDHWNDKAFVTLLSDAIEHAHLATALPNPGSVARLARSSIVNSALSVESAANICLASLPLSKTFVHDVERKLATLEKLELFLTLHKGAGVFDRGCHAVQKIHELINLRNDFVHPKSVRQMAQISKDTAGAHNATVEAGTYNHLKLVKSYRTWNGDAAVTVVRAVFEFFDQFFRQWCDWEPARTATVLSSAIVADGKEITSVIAGEIELFSTAHTLWKVPVHWIEFNVTSPIQTEGPPANA
jgi:hypothetical protein